MMRRRKVGPKISYSERRNQILRVMTYASLVLSSPPYDHEFHLSAHRNLDGRSSAYLLYPFRDILRLFVMFCAAVWAGIAYLRTRNTKWIR